MFRDDQGLLKPYSVLAWITLAFFITTRPGLSSQRYVRPPVNDRLQEVPYTRIVCKKPLLIISSRRSSDRYPNPKKKISFTGCLPRPTLLTRDND